MQNQKYIFYHLHKCAGTSVFRYFLSLDWVKVYEFLRITRDNKIKRSYLNGNLGDITDCAKGLKLEKFPYNSRLEIIKWYLEERGLNFIAFEFFFPDPVELVKDLGGHNVKTFTIFRDPVKRLLSNFKFAAYRRSRKNLKYHANLSEYIRNGNPGNYYTRHILSDLPVKPMDESTLEVAVARYSALDFLGNIETRDLREILEIITNEKSAKDLSGKSSAKRSDPELNFDVCEDELKWLFKYDYMLLERLEDRFV